MLNKKNKKKLLIIKNKAYELRLYRQLPYYLTKLISDLDGSEDDKYIKFLMEMSKHLLRVKGYYKQYRYAEVEAEKLITDGLRKLGYVVDANA